jgi:hypothetical protein
LEFVLPVVPVVRQQEDIADRQRGLPVDRKGRVGGAGLDESDAYGRIGRQAVD